MKFRKRWSGRILIYSAVATLCFAANHLFLDKTNLRAITPLSVNRTVELLTPTSTPPAQISTRAFSASCRPYSVIDNRSFFEREPPQVHLPRLASKSYRYHLLKTLRSFRLVAVACAYNVEKEIPKFRSYVERIIHVFHSSSRILIFESDSTDDTLATLRKWSSAQIYTGGRLEPTIPARSERIAYCRNILLEKARMLEPDYLLTLDLDIFAAKLSAFLTNFDYETEDWSVMTGNVVRDYYDIWALRTLSDLNLNYDHSHIKCNSIESISSTLNPIHNDHFQSGTYESDHLVNNRIQHKDLKHNSIELTHSTFNPIYNDYFEHYPFESAHIRDNPITYNDIKCNSIESSRSTFNPIHNDHFTQQSFESPHCDDF
ncbi:unnamed protein product [Rotaria sp. Silwood2]|nr:unnamed protein product [Rotaria sp. Silwood2]